jgi:hypothetical protein
MVLCSFIAGLIARLEVVRGGMLPPIQNHFNKEFYHV